MRHLSYVVVAVLAVASNANAITLNWSVTDNSAGGAPLLGFVTNDLRGDFTHNVRGQEMLVRLTAGVLYQDAVGGNGPPNGAFIPIFPSVAFDSFVAAGALIANPATDPLIVGAAVDIPGSSGVLKFDATGADITWAPGTGRDTGAVTDFILARVSASILTTGTWDLLSSDDSTGEVIVMASGTIVNGVFVPEPAFGLVGLLSALLLGRIRRN
jgi:hypothetical protein